MNHHSNYDYREHNDYLYRKLTKILATIGPACWDENSIKSLITAGVNACRINLSHIVPGEDYPKWAAVIALIRKVSSEMKLPISIVADVQGPRIRVGSMKGGSVILKKGAPITLTPEDCIGTKSRIHVSYKYLARDLHEGDLLLLDDGAILIRVVQLLPNDEIAGVVVRGGKLSSRRGINVPGVRLSLPVLTEKDLKDIDFAIAQNVDFIALSFVQTPQDILRLKEILKQKNSYIKVIAKIETRCALDAIESIADVSDGVMVARGDLALETSYEDVPIAQEIIIAVCRQRRIPVIVATQMLESMINAPKPTRAEVTDVAHAVSGGADVVMLSGETATGKYPIEAAKRMARICLTAENALRLKQIKPMYDVHSPLEMEEFVAHKTAEKAHYCNASAIVAYTARHDVVRFISHYRASSPIIIPTDHLQEYHQMTLVWGVYPVLVTSQLGQARTIQFTIAHLCSIGIVNTLDYIVVASAEASGSLRTTALQQIPDDEADVIPEQPTMNANKRHLVDNWLGRPYHRAIAATHAGIVVNPVSMSMAK